MNKLLGNNMRKLRFLFVATFFSLSSLAHAASVDCSFMSEVKISSGGEWLKSETDFMALLEKFGDGLALKIDNALLSKLDSGQPFFAGETRLGKVYLMGSEMGVEGKLINVDGDELTITDGMCTVGFGG
jgi:hypothetical protein